MFNRYNPLKYLQQPAPAQQIPEVDAYPIQPEVDAYPIQDVVAQPVETKYNLSQPAVDLLQPVVAQQPVQSFTQQMRSFVPQVNRVVNQTSASLTTGFVSLMKNTLITLIDIISTSSYAVTFYNQINQLGPESQQIVLAGCNNILDEYVRQQNREIQNLMGEGSKADQEQRAARKLAVLSIDASKKTIPNLVLSWFQLRRSLGSASTQAINTIKGMLNFKIFGGKRRSGKTSKRKHKKSRRHL